MRFGEQMPAKTLMREEDAGQICDATEEFCLAFHSLVNEAVKKVKPSLRPMLLERLQELTSVYGVKR